MARSKTRRFAAGEYYGSVATKRLTTSAVLSEICHIACADLPQHEHEAPFFSLLLAGNYSEQLGSRQNYFEPMTLWWRQAGISHKDKIGVRGGRFFNVDIRPDSTTAIRDLISVPANFNSRTGAAIPAAYRLLFEYRNWDYDSVYVIEELIIGLLECITTAESLQLSRSEPPWLATVVDRLVSLPFEQHSVGDLAIEAGVHPIHLVSAFRRFRGLTMGDFLRSIRVANAAQLLIEKRHSLAEVAAETGFYDQSHLNRVFKRWMGTTPEVFRRSF